MLRVGASDESALARGLAQGLKPTVFLLATLPFFYLVGAAWADALGPNPAEALVRSTGEWTLRFLCLVLAVTPARVAFNLQSLARVRRMLGLFVYFYACLHLSCYAWFDMGLALADILADIAKRPFILVGFTAWLALTALALTSWDRAVRFLGGRRWRVLHRLVYLIAALAILHFFWMRAGKNDFAEVAVYAGVLASLLIWRLYRALWRRPA